MPIRVRRYGTSGPWVVLLHGGPGAGGYLAPLARSLADSFRVLEPLQRGSGSEPLTTWPTCKRSCRTAAGACNRRSWVTPGERCWHWHMPQRIRPASVRWS